jgi:excinuclease UvrABC nuclease subunit
VAFRLPSKSVLIVGKGKTEMVEDPTKPQPFACYRHYDAADELLYVGVTASTGRRDSEHRGGSDWFKEIARSECTYFATRREALVFEAACIVTDEPKYNKLVDAKLLRRPYTNEIDYVPADDYRHVLRTVIDQLTSATTKSGDSK